MKPPAFVVMDIHSFFFQEIEFRLNLFPLHTNYRQRTMFVYDSKTARKLFQKLWQRNWNELSSLNWTFPHLHSESDKEHQIARKIKFICRRRCCRECQLACTGIWIDTIFVSRSIRHSHARFVIKREESIFIKPFVPSRSNLNFLQNANLSFSTFNDWLLPLPSIIYQSGKCLRYINL